MELLQQNHTYINVKFLKQIPGFSENLKGKKETPAKNIPELETYKTPETILEQQWQNWTAIFLINF